MWLDGARHDKSNSSHKESVMKKWTHKTWGFLAMFGMFSGWAMVMAGGATGHEYVLYSGGAMLGAGALYLLYRLYVMVKAREADEKSQQEKK